MDKLKNEILAKAKDELNGARDRTTTMMLRYRGFHATAHAEDIADAEDNLLGHIKYEARMEESYGKMLVYAETDDNLNFYNEYAEFLKQQNNAQLCAEDFKEATTHNN